MVRFSSSITSSVTFLDHSIAVKRKLSELQAINISDGTNIAAALESASQFVSTSLVQRPDAHRVVILLSDGDPEDEGKIDFFDEKSAIKHYEKYSVWEEKKKEWELSSVLKSKDTSVYSINVSDSSSDPYHLKRIASLPSSKFYFKVSFEELIKVLSELDPCL